MSSRITMKLKPLLPSLREKKRYIAFEVESKQEIGFEETRKQIKHTMQTLIGDLGMAKMGLLFLKDWKNSKGIMRVNTKYVDEAKASLALVTSINQKTTKIKSIKISGVLNKIRQSCF
jgi:ribonuclease P/MRP protein subunit POP5